MLEKGAEHHNAYNKGKQLLDTHSVYHHVRGLPAHRCSSRTVTAARSLADDSPPRILATALPTSRDFLHATDKQTLLFYLFFFEPDYVTN